MPRMLQSGASGRRPFQRIQPVPATAPPRAALERVAGERTGSWTGTSSAGADQPSVPVPGADARAVELPAELAGYARRKARYPAVVWAALIASVAIHWAVFELFPTMSVPVESYPVAEALQAIEIAPPEVDIPAAPARIIRPGAPVVSETGVSEAITIPSMTFEGLDRTLADLTTPLPPPPPIPDAKPEVWADQPTFTPYTIAPVLQNPEEAEREILERFPRAMRAAGVGGTVTMWFQLDETGKVLKALIATSSGYEALDEAAAEVAEILEFTPAYNRDAAVKVWVQMPIMFTVRR